MTLSARIELRPSSRLALLETSVPVVGLTIAAVTLAARCPVASPTICIVTTLAVVAACGSAWRAWKARDTRIVVVSDHAEVGVAGSDDIWRVAEPSLVRPGFAVLALVGAARRGSPPLVVPVFDRDLRVDDRRALHRFLYWCLRGGATSARP